MKDDDAWKVREYARKHRVTTRTVYRWKDKGAIDFVKTPGGGIRILKTHESSRDNSGESSDGR